MYIWNHCCLIVNDCVSKWRVAMRTKYANFPSIEGYTLKVHDSKMIIMVTK